MSVIRKYVDATDRSDVIALWRDAFGYETAHNEPSLAIEKKLGANDGLFFVAESEGTVVGTAIAGYDGHRGWLYSVAVRKELRRSGLGSSLVHHAERALAAAGCMKVNLQVLSSNEATAAFYESLGYGVERRISMGKVLGENVPRQRDV
jgi:ribosomal protein S18 acetylase RimI-like enzyme